MPTYLCFQYYFHFQIFLENVKLLFLWNVCLLGTCSANGHNGSCAVDKNYDTAVVSHVQNSLVVSQPHLIIHINVLYMHYTADKTVIVYFCFSIFTLVCCFLHYKSGMNVHCVEILQSTSIMNLSICFIEMNIVFVYIFVCVYEGNKV